MPRPELEHKLVQDIVARMAIENDLKLEVIGFIGEMVTIKAVDQVKGSMEHMTNAEVSAYFEIAVGRSLEHFCTTLKSYVGRLFREEIRSVLPEYVSERSC